MFMYIYEPELDSHLLSELLRERRCKAFLDMGCGNGVQSNSVGSADKIVCADINADAVECARKHVQHANADFIVSDLFSCIKGKFDLIAFNTPYLDDTPPHDLAWTHMQNGRDVIKRFIHDARAHLTDDGTILMVISDRGFDEYKKYAESQGYSWNVVKSKSLFFEKLYVIELRKVLHA